MFECSKCEVVSQVCDHIVTTICESVVEELAERGHSKELTDEVGELVRSMLGPMEV